MTTSPTLPKHTLAGKDILKEKPVFWLHMLKYNNYFDECFFSPNQLGRSWLQFWDRHSSAARWAAACGCTCPAAAGACACSYAWTAPGSQRNLIKSGSGEIWNYSCIHQKCWCSGVKMDEKEWKKELHSKTAFTQWTLTTHKHRHKWHAVLGPRYCAVCHITSRARGNVIICVSLFLV